MQARAGKGYIEQGNSVFTLGAGQILSPCQRVRTGPQRRLHQILMAALVPGSQQLIWNSVQHNYGGSSACVVHCESVGDQ